MAGENKVKDSTDDLMDQMAKKYGLPAAGPSAQSMTPSQTSNAAPQSAPTKQSAQPSPPPQGQGGIVNILKNRGSVIDKASGFSNGGKIKGPGTSTSDSIPARVNETGEPIRVSTDERILSKDQDGLLEVVAQGLGFDDLDALLESGTGKPVGPTVKGGKLAAADGLSPDDERIRNAFSKTTADQFGPAVMDTVPSLGTGSRVLPAPSASQVITAQSAAEQSGNDMQRSGGISGSFDGKGVNAILARENKARGEMIDLSIKANGGNGVGILGGDGQTEADKINAERTQRWAIDDLRHDLRGAGTRSAKSAIAQALTATINNQTQVRGQDLNFASELARQGLTARGQDINAASDASRNAITLRGQDINAMNEAARLGIDSERLDIQRAGADQAADKWGIEKKVLTGQVTDSEAMRKARTDLQTAIDSGDSTKIEAARSKAVAAGIKFDKPNNEFTYVPDQLGGGVMVNKDTGAAAMYGRDGKKTADIPAPVATKPTAPVPAGYTVVGTANGKRVLQDGNGKRFVEGG